MLFKKWLVKNEKTRPPLGIRFYQKVNSIVSHILEDQERLLNIAERIIKVKKRI